MTQQRSPQRVVQFTPKPDRLQATIRKLASEKDSPAFSRHAWDRMDERGITNLDAIRVLRTGVIKGDIEAGKNVGEWKCKMVAAKKGGRDIGVVTVVIREERLFVKTVEWEDL